ncbi:MAG: hypothetical protein ACREE6_08835, partial [Limisphaerales bacterium]
MKKVLWILAGVAIGLSASHLKIHAQSYPYWDAPEQLTALDQDAQYNSAPILATTNAIFGFDLGYVARWTECGGWEDIGGLTADGWPSPHVNGLVHTPLVMTVHDHYLYAVGFYSLPNQSPANCSDLCSDDDEAPFTNDFQIVRLDLNTGTWTALGQNFTAQNITTPTTIAVDANNWIYVGFELSSANNGTTVDMLDVSTNGGASWQEVGQGLVTISTADPDISALYADGTNIYIGGGFSGPPGINSPNLVIWTGNAWRATAGINSSYYDDFGSPNWGVDVVNSI